MDKYAQTKSPDPVQQQLRDHKKQWNKATSGFISALIAFKKALNGRGDTKLGLPPSNIKYPLPNEVVAFLGQLTSEFERISSSANVIIKEQENYSKTRKQKREVRASQLKTASSKISRLWSYVSSVLSKDEYKHYRLGMLKSAVILESNLKKFRSKVLERSISSIPQSMDLYMTVVYGFSSLREHFNRLLTFEAAKKSEEKGEAPTTVIKTKPEDHKEKREFVHTNILSMKDLKKDLASIIDIGMSAEVLLPIENKISAYDKEKDLSKKETIESLIWDEYEKLLRDAKKFVQTKLNKVLSEDFSTLEELADEYMQYTLQTKSYMYIGFKKEAGFLDWMKENIYKMTPFEMTAASKLEVSSTIKQAIKKLNEIMDILEVKIDAEKIKELLEELKIDLEEIKAPLKILTTVHKEHYLSKDKKDKTKHQDLLEMELRRKIKRDIDKELLYE